MTRNAEPLPAPLRGGPFSVAQARRAGVSRGRLRGRDLVAPFHGVRASTAPSEPLELVESYRAALEPGAFLSHSTAALLHGMWLPLRLEREMVVHAAVLLPRRAPRGGQVRGRSLTDRSGLVWTIRGLPVANLWETWAQLARLLTVDELVVAVESLLAKGRSNPFLMLQRLAAVAADEARPFQKRLHRAAALLRIGSRSAAETRFRLFLVRNGLPEPLINHDIRDAQGRFVAEGDLVYPEEHVLIEYEGDGHREKQQFRKDIHRVERIQDEGWRVVRVTADDETERPEETLDRVRRALDRGRALGRETG